MPNPTSGSSHSTNQPRPIRSWVRANPADLVDVFVYVVVLNLAVQFVPSIISESFTMSLLTAVLLKVALELVIGVKKKAVSAFRSADTNLAKAGSGLVLWGFMIGSKIAVLWLVEFAFGGAVTLGGFWPVTGLVFVLLLARKAVRSMLLSEQCP